MSFTTVADDHSCLLPEGVAPGPYDVEITNGVVTLHPLVRAQDVQLSTPGPVHSMAGSRMASRRRGAAREYKGRSWNRVPPGTRLIGPHSVGAVTMGSRGELSNGRTPNQHLVDNGVTANAWQVFKLEDGRTVGAAYDMNAWA